MQIPQLAIKKASQLCRQVLKKWQNTNLPILLASLQVLLVSLKKLANNPTCHQKNLTNFVGKFKKWQNINLPQRNPCQFSFKLSTDRPKTCQGKNDLANFVGKFKVSF